MRMGVCALIVAALLMISCIDLASRGGRPLPDIAPPGVDDVHATDYQSLHNVVAYAPGYYGGAAPGDEQAFAELAALGVKTIVSVDGAAPDVELAKRFGIRYVHLPIGYDGMDRQRTLEIARALHDLPGPAYVHCHHGKHRSSGAIGAAMVTLGLIDHETAAAKMKISGLSPSYTGLHACVAEATPASKAELLTASNAFPERWQTTGLVNSMVEISHAMEHLKDIQKAGWTVPADHPDLVPAAEAGRLADLLRNLRDDGQVKAKPAEFSEWLLHDSQLAEALEADLAAGSADRAALDAKMKAVAQSCTVCHRKYRD